MKRLFTLFFLFLSLSIFSQETIKEVLSKYNNEKIPYIQPYRTSVLRAQNSYILDARELKEFEVSHLENAIHVGYDNFDLEATQKLIPNKNTLVVVYCTLGVRSEDIAEKLKTAGYSNVFNLFGGIVQWKNEGLPVFDAKGKETKRVHVFSKEWGKWLKSGRKVY
jgi:rhodanese-related sulfurtransferase